MEIEDKPDDNYSTVDSALDATSMITDTTAVYSEVSQQATGYLTLVQVAIPQCYAIHFCFIFCIQSQTYM